MRQRIKFPHREKPVLREVHEYPKGVFYIKSKGCKVMVRKIIDVWSISPEWNYLYIKKQGKE